MSIHELERVGSDEGDYNHEAEQRDREFFETAIVVCENSRAQTVLDLFISGEIHKHAGGGLRALDRSGRIFWHNHGTFVAKSGAVYHLRTDDEGEPQVYISPASSREGGLYCVQPCTYDGYSNSDGSEMRFDFINGANHALPRNSLYEVEQQRQDGLDVMRPRHQDGTAFDSRRDSISIACGPGGAVRAAIHDSKTNLTEYLHNAVEIKSLVELISTLE